MVQVLLVSLQHQYWRWKIHLLRYFFKIKMIVCCIWHKQAQNRKMQSRRTTNLWTRIGGSFEKDSKQKFEIYNKYNWSIRSSFSSIFGLTNANKKLRLTKGESLRPQLYWSWSEKYRRLLQLASNVGECHSGWKIDCTYWNV